MPALKSLRNRLCLGVAALATTASVGLGAAAPAQAVEIDAGYATSSYYLSRSETRALSANANTTAGGAGALCAGIAAAAAPLGASCGLWVAVQGGRMLDMTAAAADGNGCLRIRVVGNPATWAVAPSHAVSVLNSYNDGGIHCRD